MNDSKVSAGEILKVVASWLLRKKTQLGKNSPKKCHGNAHFIIQRFPAVQLESTAGRITKQEGKQDYKLIVHSLVHLLSTIMSILHADLEKTYSKLNGGEY